MMLSRVIQSGGAGRFAAVRFASTNTMNYFQQRSLPINTVVKFVPQQQAWVVERMGRFNRILQPGLAVLVPFLDKIAYVKSLKENAVEVPRQSAITSDNVTLEMDGILYVRIFDAYKASYGVEDAEYAISQLAQTTMRSEIGQLTLDHVLRERQQLNLNITAAINEAAKEWGITCLRYEIKDIHPPNEVLEAMHRQVSAERSKRAEILESEGHRQAAINKAEGTKQSIILAAEATAQGIRQVADAIAASPQGRDAVSLQVADRYVDAFGKLAKESNTVVIPQNLGDMGSMIAGGMAIFDKVSQKKSVEPESK
ncbi:Uncharacterized protein C16G5.07c [Wickerhamiella sorbophila]|uniref:Uncharacterized protein C16G5.07c n=1 Tax=Wickerhamiella sorbophila TaxID=45607 RepID=A0A2T0FD10_9ASCO|nr:Uncharacterized protein C16G5.07c [Wickerhamiella sorbophila]PRT52855.1 Uncharacterized protein C16G5.07c [Wickerhamiella sorbophila]